MCEALQKKQEFGGAIANFNLLNVWDCLIVIKILSLIKIL